jgi:hypothetical protein
MRRETMFFAEESFDFLHCTFTEEPSSYVELSSVMMRLVVVAVLVDRVHPSPYPTRSILTVIDPLVRFG